ncbi:dTDP-glucose 4,6-dehydratase [Nakamurella flavida]|uniref:dTDP-glucose 4,6-dehydratase n=1 Tax=Nakamurella flavida TaxID=363630 RepID=A0A938YPG7_9ACTN|nr:dTDP-glucose 4,6-dehydratase [Nakamurella flavida]MBM9478503.1 dTDP-glucose 4,6-dehydratase [Nakamurella flavida]MDP9777671.1 dTDP-glucose 4,6-dehydratase [Nakamurella flavida]
MRILVTGGAGFIGSAFVRNVLADQYPGLEGAEVTVLDKLTYAGNLANLQPVAEDDRYTFVQGDICDAELARELVGKADSVVHFAAESHVDRSILGGADFVLTNVLGTQTLLQAAMDTKLTKFVHVSTDEVYGSIDEGSWDEEFPLRPNSPYSASKASSDLIARAYAKTHNLPVAITRCSNNYGPYQFPEKVIPLFVTNLMDGLTVPLYGKGGQIRDWLHVDDHCRGIALVLAEGRAGEVYNIGGGTELTNVELTEKLLEATGRDESFIERIVDPRGAAHDQRYSVDISKINAELGYSPRVTFEQGLAETVAWYRDNRDWWEPLKARSVIDR